MKRVIAEINGPFGSTLAAILISTTVDRTNLYNNSSSIQQLLISVFADLDNHRHTALGWDIRSEVNAMRIAYEKEGLSQSAIVTALPKETLRRLLCDTAFNRAREMQLTANFDENAKELTLNQFSLAIFKQHITTHKKLSGKDVIRYLDKLPTPSVINRDSEVTALEGYRKLLLSNAKTKSIALVDRLIQSANRDPHLKREERAIDVINSARDIAVGSDITLSTHAHFSESFFHSSAQLLGTSLRVSALNLPSNCLHKYVTGIAKPSSMSNYDVIYAVDKLVILSALASKDRHPYYDIAIDQLVIELSTNSNSPATLEAYTESYQDMQTATTYTNELLTTILKGNNK